jgi:hypothetical protein
MSPTSEEAAVTRVLADYYEIDAARAGTGEFGDERWRESYHMSVSIIY